MFDDDLARALASRYRVVCPDVVGRGRSSWLPHRPGTKTVSGGSPARGNAHDSSA